MSNDTPNPGVFAIVLAAGCSSRFGATKQLAEIDGVPLVRHSIDVAASACGENTVLVVGHDWQAVSAACAGAPGFLVVNDNYREGLGTSLALAVRSVRHTAPAVIVLLADQALISADHIRALSNGWSGKSDEIVATSYAGTTGTPVLFPRDCFKELVKLKGDAGGRHLLDDARFDVKTIEFEPAAIDIDTPADLKKL